MPSTCAVVRTALLLATIVAALAPEAAASPALTASWIDNSNGTAITRLERRLAADAAFVVVADVPPGVTAYVDASVTPGAIYCYRAMAYDEAGVSPYTDEACGAAAYDGNDLRVTVSKSGDGAGSVGSTPAGIACGTSCSATYLAGTPVTLTATAAVGSTFTGWSGGCAGTGACTVAGNAPVTVTASFTATPASLTAGFVDVPFTHPFAAWIEAVAEHGIATGCAENPPQFCPGAWVTRREMAVLLLRGMHGVNYQPRAAVGTFSDVSITSPFTPWIEELAAESITSGCSTNPALFCPDGTVTRAQMAVFLIRATHGVAFEPPGATGVFDDVPVSHPLARWIEMLARDQVTTGCGLGNYCPDAPVTRGQMAVFLVRAFNVPL